MAAVVHRDPQLLKCLQKLRRAGGRAALAAERVEAILAQMVSQAALRPETVHKLTQFGEHRIARCKKFNLGGGYRLVYIQEDQHYVFLFAGTHDDCDRWLTNNKYLKADIPAAPSTCPQPHEASPWASVQPEPTGEMDYDDVIMQHIDEKMLRRIFRGLCGEE